MSSDGYFDDDDEFNASALLQLDAIEAAHLSPRKVPTAQAVHPTTSPAIVAPKTTARLLGKEDSFCDISFNVDEADLAQLDNFIEDVYQGKARPVTGPSKFSRSTSSNKLQTTLFGDILQPTASSSSSKPKPQLERTKSTPRNPFGQQAQKTKQWDHTQFAKTGVRKAKSVKGKGKVQDGADDEEEEQVEFEQFPAPFVSLGPPPPMKLTADLLEAKHWIFPTNRSKRDYQYNIIKNSLFENTLVALPTGLGKTFIAGVVMLNYYRWFPEGKVVFVAPTKPLVSQQVIACHETCGIPGGDSIELTGEVAAAVRTRYWKEKRVFFMTPQTLVNDLVKENCDARDIVLLVVDEAHRATGDYAYNQVIRFLMAKNPHFRVLALTATPGNSPEAIQLLIDGLHISRIEIRDEQSVDLRSYIHKKVFKAHLITTNDELAHIRDLLAKVMEPIMKPLSRAGIFHPGETAIRLHPYRPQAAMATCKDRRLFGPLSILAKLARAMMYLLTGSFQTSYTFLMDVSNDQAEDEEGAKKKNAAGKKLKDDPNFRTLMLEFQLQRNRGFSVHPKMEKMKTILIQHFGSKIGEETETPDDSKVMVFSTYRGVVDEIVEELNKDRPLIRAARFIGQGTDKQGKKGLAQKDQIDIIKRFKAGEFNVLVATSIGEEGLDIGEIDMTICYDADKAPTRMIQRFGRTGRKREGIIHALLFEGREEENINKAEATYKEVQKTVNKGVSYELYGDVKRLIPDHIKPECVEKVVEIEHYVREEGRKKRSPKKAGAKRKRNDDVARNIPDGASTGFVSVRDLVVKGGSKKPKKVTLPRNFDDLGQDDDTDDDIQSGRILAPPRRTQSAAAGPSSTAKKAPKLKLKKSATIASGSKAAKSQKQMNIEVYSSNQFSQQCIDDSDDLDIMGGVLPSLTTRTKPMSGTPEPTSPTSTASPIKKKRIGSVLELSESEQDDSGPPKPPSLNGASLELSDSDCEDLRPGPSSLRKQINKSVLELSESENDNPSEDDNPSPKRDRYTFLSPGPAPLDDLENEHQNMSWLVDDDDDDNRRFEIVDSSPLAPKRTSTFERMEIEDDSIDISGPMPQDEDFVVATSDPLECPMDESVQFVAPVSSMLAMSKKRAVSTESPSKRRSSPALRSPSRRTNAGEETLLSFRRPGPSKFIASSPTSIPSSSPLHPRPEKPKTAMLPPALPRRLMASLGHTSFEVPEPSFPVRPAGNQAKRRRVILDDSESPVLDLPPPSQRRLRRVESTPVRTKSKDKAKPFKRAKPSLLARNVNPLFDGEAMHSGDEESEGYSEEDEESESDRQFIKNSPATQVSQSYDQSLIYRRSLLTQAPLECQGPAFANRPVRAKPFGKVEPRHQHRYLPSSSPPPPDDDLDHYEIGGSFVVDDDAEISYEL